MQSWRTRLVLLAIVVATIGCDQASKHVASARLVDGQRQSYLGDAVRLEYSENPGGFLSLGADLPGWARTAVFSGGSAILLVASVFSAFWHKLGRLALLGLWLWFAGTASNLVDRVGDGRVVDFLNVGIGPLRTGIFNVADMAIMLGVALLIAGLRAMQNAEDEPA
jgi:signal peptidase II